jgi:hypothetical protein
VCVCVCVRVQTLYGLVHAKKAAKLLSEGKKMKVMIPAIEKEIFDKVAALACRARTNKAIPPGVMDRTLDEYYMLNTREQARLAREKRNGSNGNNATAAPRNRARMVVRMARLAAPPVSDAYCSAGAGDGDAWFARAHRGQGPIVHRYQHCCATACRDEESRWGAPSAAVDSCCVACNRYSCNPMSRLAKLSTEVASQVTVPALDDGTDPFVVRITSGL